MSTTIKEKAKALINEISINAYQASSRLISSDYMRTTGSLDLIIKVSKEAKKVVEKLNKPKKKKSKTVSGVGKTMKKATKRKVAKRKPVKRKVKRTIIRKRRK